MKKFALIIIATSAFWSCSADVEESEAAPVSVDVGAPGTSPATDGALNTVMDGPPAQGDIDAEPLGDRDATPRPPADSGPTDAAHDASRLPMQDAASPSLDAAPRPERPFSFFVTSLEAMQALSGSEDGFGGDLGGLEGADAICQTIADGVGVGHKEWRAFLSVVNGPDGGPVNAIDRIGEGPWYDANHRLVAENLAGLIQERPVGDPVSVNDLPNEFGQPLSLYGNAHDIPTGSNRRGELDDDDPEATCNDWTSAESIGQNRVMCGHSYPRRGGRRRGAQWIADHRLRGCTPGVNFIQNGRGEGDCIGCSGGYGGIYCFALSP